MFVNLFIPSELAWKEKGFKLNQETAFPENGTMVFTIESAATSALTFNIRYPSWATDGASVKVNGKVMNVNQMPGSYIAVNRKWKSGDKIEVNFPMSLHTVAANTDAKKIALLYGPIVLAGEMGAENFTGNEPYSNPLKYNDYYTYDYHQPKNIPAALTLDINNINNAVQSVNGLPLTFKTVKEGITLRPLYDIHRERYVVYWDLK